MIVYLAGGMHSNWQDIFIDGYPDIEFIDPRSHGLSDPEDYTLWDMKGIERADIVIAYLEKSNPSGLGMAFEIGYAVGLGKPVIFENGKQDKYAKMLEHASGYVCNNLNEVIEVLDEMVIIYEYNVRINNGGKHEKATAGE